MPTSATNNHQKNFYPNHNHQEGFTLVELLVVLVVVAILGTASYFGFRGDNSSHGNLRLHLQQTIGNIRQKSFHESRQIIATIDPYAQQIILEDEIILLPKELKYRTKSLLQKDFRGEKIDIRALPVGYVEPFWLEAVDKQGERVVYTLIPLTAEIFIDEVLSAKQ